MSLLEVKQIMKIPSFYTKRRLSGSVFTDIAVYVGSVSLSVSEASLP